MKMEELLEWVWLRLAEVKDVLYVCGKGMEADIGVVNGAELTRSVIHVVENQIGEIVDRIDRSIK